MAAPSRDARRTLYLVDGNAQIHRAFHAIRGLATSRGLPTNASYGFTTMLRKLLADEKPELVGICFDPPGRTQRHAEYAEYKANRPKMDDALAVQLPYVRRVCEAFRLRMIEVPGWEADDVIASLARQAVEAGLRVVVVSADKDLLQLVDGDVTVLNPGREGSGATLFDAKAVEEKFGVPAERVVDVLALVGDAVDNVPGVPGIGDKGARDLVREFGPLEAVLEHADEIKRASYREGLKANREAALLSKQLVTLHRDAPVSLELDTLRRGAPDRELAFALFSELEFQAFAREFAPEVRLAGSSTRVARSAAEVREVAAAARAAGRVALSLLASAREPMRARAVGIGLAWAQGQAAYVPLGHQGLGGPSAKEQQEALAALEPLLADPKLAKLSGNAKHDRILLARAGCGCEGLAFDALIAAYLLNPGKRAYSLDELCLEFLGAQPRPRPETAIDTLPVEGAADLAGSDADLLLRLADAVLARVREAGLLPVYQEMELPLVPVLADMERAGVKVDRELLARMSAEMEARIGELTTRIHELAGGEFNLNSPIQLREILFEKLGLKSGKKTAKTRAQSTAEEVLEELAAGHDLPRLILDYRAVQKLKSTYVDALPELVHPETGRIHASLNQTVAATGRISSSDPNLQNIPIRTAEGRRIRAAFVAEPGHLLLSADYSQIELRVLAHLSQDAGLIDAFRRGEDIHDRTAREVFGPFSPMPADEQRRVSKMINYALLYGKTAFTLAKDIGVPRKDAESFIQAYFARYPAVRRFIDETLASARRTGEVRTLLGRLRRLPDINAKNFQVRAEAERQAMNAPVQGSAADLIKKAMVELHAELRERRMRTRLILQIHDELLLEAPESEADAARALVVERMEGALKLDVPLVVDARLGRNWAEAH
ncbi:MAG: DNA polymerase I [Vicinamibacteria bacterium]